MIQQRQNSLEHGVFWADRRNLFSQDLVPMDGFDRLSFFKEILRFQSFSDPSLTDSLLVVPGCSWLHVVLFSFSAL